MIPDYNVNNGMKYDTTYYTYYWIFLRKQSSMLFELEIGDKEGKDP